MSITGLIAMALIAYAQKDAPQEVELVETKCTLRCTRDGDARLNLIPGFAISQINTCLNLMMGQEMGRPAQIDEYDLMFSRFESEVSINFIPAIKVTYTHPETGYVFYDRAQVPGFVCNILFSPGDSGAAEVNTIFVRFS